MSNRPRIRQQTADQARRVFAYAHQLTITTPATQLNSDLGVWAVERGADAALDTGRAAVVVGRAGDELVVCLDGCCTNRPGVLIVVPDLVVAEFHANGLPAPFGPTVVRRDGRSVKVFAGAGGGHD
jgi:hypothetical protein